MKKLNSIFLIILITVIGNFDNNFSSDTNIVHAKQTQPIIKPNPALLEALKEAAGYQQTEHWSSSQYFYQEADLNGDKIKEAIILLNRGIPCSNRSCAGFIFKKNQNSYQLIGTTSVSRGSDFPLIAILKSKHNGWFDIATYQFDYNEKKQWFLTWKLTKFDGSKYAKTSQNLGYVPKNQLPLPDVMFTFSDIRRGRPKGYVGN
ncbi:MAG: hypothetical protein KME64_04035 [Scytonematopsis contorta HA4267-MV1]|jgi:hypothetical protein|nr:hypothetical protein [Scytonematopsis contorta HA4267-MV1]